MGQVPNRANITSITNANPCVVTVDVANAYADFQNVRLTNLNGAMPVPQNGAALVNNGRYAIINTGTYSFSLHDPISLANIDSTNYPPYSQGGYCNIIEQNFIYQDNGDNNG